MDLDDFKEIISSILPHNVSGNKPHKVLALLAIIEGISSGIYVKNKFYFDSDFRYLFSNFFYKFARKEDRNRPLNPFFHLRSNSFWKLMPNEGKEEKLGDASSVGSPRDLSELVSYAYLDEKVYTFLQEKNHREAAQDFLIQSLSSNIEKDSQALPIKSKFPHERHALETITQSLKNQAEFIPNYDLYDPATNQYFECDLIAIAGDLIAIIEVKHWAGKVEILPHNWRINGKYRKDPHKSNKYKCQVLRSFIDKAFPYLPNIWVESIVVLTNPDAVVHNVTLPKKAPNNPTFGDIDALVQFFNYRSGSHKPLLSVNDRQKIAEKLREQTTVPRGKALYILGYDILENLTQTAQKIELLVKPANHELQTVKRLRVFTVDPNLSQTEREEQKIKYLNSLKAVEQVGSHPNLVKVEYVPNEEGLIIEASDWSEQGTLADVMTQKGKFSLSEAANIVQGITQGLVALHDRLVIHRDLRPENIMMAGDTPKIMNFDYCYLPDNIFTVFPDASSLKPSPYIAPELYIDKQFAEATDLFSVGILFYTLLCGTPPFKESLYLLKGIGGLTEDQLGKLKKLQTPAYIIEIIASLIQKDRNKRPQEAKEILTILQKLSPEKEKEPPKPEPNEVLQPGASYDVFKIEEFIGMGREAQVYRAQQIGDRTVAIKLFHQEVPRDRIVSEQNNLELVKSPFVLHSHGLHQWRDGRFFLVTNLIKGPSLRTLINKGERPDLTQFKQVTSCLLEALLAMHKDSARETVLLHNDIKPDNILLTANGDPALIDFGTASYPHIGPYMGTDLYVAPDLLRKIDFDFCESGDLFALGITLFEWLCGKRPYDSVPNLEEFPKTVRDFRHDKDIPDSLIDWLDQAIQPRRDDGFANIIAMQEVFNKAMWPSKEPIIVLEPKPAKAVPSHITRYGENNFVTYLNTLHNATASDENALAESQAQNRYFGDIHVGLNQTDYILKKLTDSEGTNVILTGHAGDGKSTIALELYKKIRNLQFNKPLDQPFTEHEIIPCNGFTIHIIKDMSEFGGKQRRKNILDSLDLHNTTERWFIISNSGTLLSTFEDIAKEKETPWPKLENQLLESLDKNDPEPLDIFGTCFTVINLAKTDNVDTGVTVLKRIIDHSAWQDCEICDLEKSCPVYRNVIALRQAKDTALRRIYWIYRRLNEYGSRLTMRQITGHLAYSLTGGLDCRTIRDQAAAAIPPDSMDTLFCNRFFGYKGVEFDEQAKRLTAVGHIEKLEMGSKPFPGLDRVLWNSEDAMLPTLPETMRPIADELCNRIKIGSPSRIQASRIRQALRRIYYIFGDFPDDMKKRFIPLFLDSQMLVEAEEWQNQRNGPDFQRKSGLLSPIFHVLQEEYTGLKLSESNETKELYITLRRRQEGYRQSVQILLAEIPFRNFSLEWERLNDTFKQTRYVLILVEKMSGYELRLELPFLDFVLMHDMGEVGQRLNPGYKNRLERFKAQLLEHPAHKVNQLKLLEMDRDGSLKTKTLMIQEQQLQVM